MIGVRGFFCLGLFLLIAGCDNSLPPFPESPVNKNRIFNQDTTPKNSLLDNACVLLRHYPHWRQPLALAKKNWRLEPATALAVIYQESKFNPKALSNQKAYGYPQALDRTWFEYQKLRPAPNALRSRFDDSVDFIGFYFYRSSKAINLSINDAYNQYLAYHEGVTGFIRKTHRKKPWLIKVARSVDRRADMYRAQLKRCGF